MHEGILEVNTSLIVLGVLVGMAVILAVGVIMAVIFCRTLEPPRPTYSGARRYRANTASHCTSTQATNSFYPYDRTPYDSSIPNNYLWTHHDLDFERTSHRASEDDTSNYDYDDYNSSADDTDSCDYDCDCSSDAGGSYDCGCDCGGSDSSYD